MSSIASHTSLRASEKGSVLELTVSGGTRFRVSAVNDPLDARVCAIRIEAVEEQATSPSQDCELLTGRESEVVKLVAEGLTNAEIAEELCISLSTVKSHLQSIFSKWKVSNRTMLVRKYRDALVF